MNVPDPSLALNRTLLSRLRLRHLALLALIAQHRRISRVAEVMRMGQPAITKALKDVEDIFAVELFERAPGGLRPTGAGEAVLHYAEAALADLAITAQKLVAIAGGLHGRLRLGVVPHAPDALVAAAMRHLLAASPRLSVVVREMVTADLVDGLVAHELDCAIGRPLRRELDADIVTEPIFEQVPAVLVTPAIFDRIARRPLDWKVLAELDWIQQPPNTPTRYTVDAIFVAAGVPPPVPVVETASLRAIESALRMLPSGITVLARDLGERLVAAGACRQVPYDLQWNLPPICLLMPKASHTQPTLAALADAIRAAGKELALIRQVRHSANY